MTLFTVILAPKLAVGVLTKFDPVTVTFRVVFLLPLFGEHKVTVGGGGGGVFTVNPATNVPLCRSGFVTVTFLDPGVADGLTEMSTFSLAEFWKPTDVTEMPEPKPTVGKLTKFAPRTVIVGVPPCVALFGVQESTLGGGAGGVLSIGLVCAYAVEITKLSMVGTT